MLVYNLIYKNKTLYINNDFFDKFTACKLEFILANRILKLNMYIEDL